MLHSEEPSLSNQARSEPQSPQIVPPIPPPVEPAKATNSTFVPPAEFLSPEPQARRTVIASIVNMVFNGASIGVSLLQIALMQASVAAGAGTNGLLSVTDVIATILALAMVGLWFVFLILLLIWVYRCYANLKALGAQGLSMTPGWAVGNFFVPFLNLVRPYEVVREIWKASHPAGLVSVATNTDSLSWKKLAAPALIGWWWFCWVLSQFTSIFSGLAQSDTSPTPAQWQQQTLVEVGALLFDFIPFYLTILVVRRITELQMEKAALVAEAGKPEPFDSAGAIPQGLS